MGRIVGNPRAILKPEKALIDAYFASRFSATGSNLEGFRVSYLDQYNGFNETFQSLHFGSPNSEINELNIKLNSFDSLLRAQINSFFIPRLTNNKNVLTATLIIFILAFWFSFNVAILL